MATNLTSVALTAPAATVSLLMAGSFSMEITGSYQGGGGVTSHDLTWEFDQGTSTWITIPASGGTLGLYTGDTNPVTGKTTTDLESITVVSDKLGSYQIRGKGVIGGSTFYTSEQTVDVGTIHAAQVLAQVEWQVPGLVRAHQILAQVEWAESSSDIKSIDGVLLASIKSVGGVDIGGVKSICGVDN